MSREDVRETLASWEADSAEYQRANASQLERYEWLGWGTWGIPEDRVGALGDVTGLDSLELGCGACQFGVGVAMRGAHVVGLDFSANQLLAGVETMERSGVRFPLVRASAEELPFAADSFDLVFCDHGAMSFADPHLTVPEAVRVLRSAGLLVFDMVSPIYSLFAPDDDDEPTGRSVRRPYFGMGRSRYEDEVGTWVQWQLTYGDWIRLFCANGLLVEDLIELRPDPEATTTYDLAPLEWARDLPGEHIWKVRKA